MKRNKFVMDVMKMTFLILLGIVLCHVTKGVMVAVIAMMGAAFAIQRKPGYFTVCFILLPFFVIFNRVVIGVSPIFLASIRIGNFFLIAVMLLSGAGFAGRARERLPIGWIFAYVFVACLSSIGGWMPLISYLKLFQFVLFMVGLMLVTRIMQFDDKSLYQIRCTFMAFAVIMIIGSMMARFVPSVGFSMYESRLGDFRFDGAAAEALKAGGTLYFNGLACHSQILPPAVAVLGGWVLCDMLLVERRICWLHMLCLVFVPVLLFMSRSRGGLLELVAVIFIAFFVCLPRSRLSLRVKSRLTSMLFCAIGLLVVVAVISQIRNQSISKWLRKTDDVGGDNRSLKDAFTGSRQESVEWNLSDFRRSPLIGMGFQVVPGMEQAYRAGMITWYSASIEKGVTPYVILGETGILGAIVFTIFLISFYATCLKRRYLSLLTSFTCVLVANLADSTLFSPGGMGGFLWITSCIGAFSTDLLSKRTSSLPPPPQSFRL